MSRKQSKAVVKDAQQVVKVPGKPVDAYELYELGNDKPIGFITENGVITNAEITTAKQVETHDKKVLAIMLELCDGVQALNGSIYPWKKIREDIVRLLEK